jgi:SAM-dependent methyltransferase
MTGEATDHGTPVEGSQDMVEPWDIVANGYTTDIIPMSDYFAGEALRLASLPPSSHIVDVATGPGPLALLAARKGATVSAIDFSPAMIANLHRRADELGLSLSDVRVGDGQDLPYEDDTFDGAFSLLGLIFFSDRAAGFRELYRVLRQGRSAVVSSMASLSDQFVTAVESIGAVLPDMPLATAVPPLSDPEVFEAEMSAVGFREVKIHTISYSESTPTTSDFWGKVQRGAFIFAVLRHKLGEERWVEVSNDVLYRLQDALGDGLIEEVYHVHMGVGIK